MDAGAAARPDSAGKGARSRVVDRTGQGIEYPGSGLSTNSSRLTSSNASGSHQDERLSDVARGIGCRLLTADTVDGQSRCGAHVWAGAWRLDGRVRLLAVSCGWRGWSSGSSPASSDHSASTRSCVRSLSSTISGPTSRNGSAMSRSSPRTRGGLARRSARRRHGSTSDRSKTSGSWWKAKASSVQRKSSTPSGGQLLGAGRSRRKPRSCFAAPSIVEPCRHRTSRSHGRTAGRLLVGPSGGTTPTPSISLTSGGQSSE